MKSSASRTARNQCMPRVRPRSFSLDWNWKKCSKLIYFRLSCSASTYLTGTQAPCSSTSKGDIKGHDYSAVKQPYGTAEHPSNTPSRMGGGPSNLHAWASSTPRKFRVRFPRTFVAIGSQQRSSRKYTGLASFQNSQ